MKKTMKWLIYVTFEVVYCSLILILRDVLWPSFLHFSIIYRWFHLYVTEDSVNFSIQLDSVWNLLFSLP